MVDMDKMFDDWMSSAPYEYYLYKYDKSADITIEHIKAVIDQRACIFLMDKRKILVYSSHCIVALDVDKVKGDWDWDEKDDEIIVDEMMYDKSNRNLEPNTWMIKGFCSC